MSLLTASERFELAVDVEHARTVVDFALDAMALPPSNESLRVTRVFPSGDGMCIQYVAERKSPGGPVRVILCGFLPFEEDAFPDWAGQGTAFRMPGSGLVVPAFPFDPGLPALRGMLSGEGLVAWLRECGVGVTDAGAVETKLLGYRLLRRCVLKHTVRGADGRIERIVTKLVRPRRGGAMASTWRALSGAGPADVRLPRLLAVNEASGAVGMEHVAGRSLHDCIGDVGFADACEAAGEVLNALYARSVPNGLPARSAADELRSLDRFGGLMARTCPADTGPVERLITRLKRFPPPTPVPRVAHGDFYDKQLILSSGGMVMIDWDLACAGDPAMDAGNFLAHLELRELQHPAAGDGIEAGRLRLLATLAGCSEGERWWRAASLTRLAVLYRWRPRWRHLFPAIVAKADEALDRGGYR